MSYIEVSVAILKGMTVQLTATSVMCFKDSPRTLGERLEESTAIVSVVDYVDTSKESTVRSIACSKAGAMLLTERL